MDLGLLFTYGVAICIVYGAYHGLGIGQTIWVLPQERRLRIALSNWVLEKFWPSAQVCLKVPIVLFLRHLLGSVDRFGQCATAVIVLIVFWGLTAVMGNTFQCWPVQYFWIKHIPGY
ncbi:uncharacterized protein PFLUO_LOCUS5817 [Penicillium psychrofluorescens]|uniref:uncharacterized protein n=1 Tax=Penicillium psychrofluorescens TaxID=3158075 RepID=UPI003CCDAF2E